MEIPEGRIDLAYSARSSDFRGSRTLSIEWVDWKPAEANQISLKRTRQKIQVHDHRKDPHPFALLEKLRLSAQAQIWREGSAREEVAGVGRDELLPGEVLVIWTPPPGPDELRAAVQCVDPREIYLFNQGHGMDQREWVCQRLSGMVNYAIRQYDGRIDLERAAAATGQRDDTIRAGFDWLTARGGLQIDRQDGNQFLFKFGGDADLGQRERAEHRMDVLLRETRAYREYYARVSPGILLETDIE
jgi:hypothetical protein